MTSSAKTGKLDENARKWGTTPAERDFYKANAKRRLTMWGNKSTPVLYEYASKVLERPYQGILYESLDELCRCTEKRETTCFDGWKTGSIHPA